MLHLCYNIIRSSMFLVAQFDKHIKHNYNMNIVNQNKRVKKLGAGE
jgi:hypothetical protein